MDKVSYNLLDDIDDIFIEFNQYYKLTEVNPNKWCKDYEHTYNKLLFQLNKNNAPIIFPRKLHISKAYHPYGAIQAKLDFMKHFQ